MLAAFTGFIVEIRYMNGQTDLVKEHEYGMEPLTVNTDISYVQWSGMLSYITIYSALWENTACIIQLYSEYEHQKQFILKYSVMNCFFAMYVTIGSATAYDCFG